MIRINEDMKKYIESVLDRDEKSQTRYNLIFDQIYNNLPKFSTGQFNGDEKALRTMNLKHELNYFSFDKYGLLVRKNDYNSKKTAYGWMLDENDLIINIHSVTYALHRESADVIRSKTIQYIGKKFPTLFNKPRGVLYKIYGDLIKT